MDDVIAIDGPAAAGKSTVAEQLARRLGVPNVNTGNMYRALTWALLQSGYDLERESNYDEFLSGIEMGHRLNANGSLSLLMNGRELGQEIRSPELAAKVSKLAAIPEMRAWLIERQRSSAALGRIVMEGRDIGTVVFPKAKFKFFLTASPELRARRRLQQDGETVSGATVASVAAEIAERDRLDMNRKIAPLRRAEDATLIDSSEMTVDEVVDFIANLVKDENKQA